MSSGKSYSWTCDKCSKIIGPLDEDEFAFFAFGGDEGMLCFDCDPESAATTPSIFWQFNDGDEIEIDGQVLVGRDGYMRAKEMPHVRAHERKHVRGLSSYTNLNRISKNQGVLENLYTYELCPECHGETVYIGSYRVASCELCENRGAVRILDKWVRQLLGLGCENV